MHVLGHDDVSNDDEVITTAHLFENVEQEIADLSIVQQWTPLITTRGNEMGVTGAVLAMEAVRHGRRIAQGSAFWL